MKIKIPKNMYMSDQFDDYELITYAALKHFEPQTDYETGFMPVIVQTLIYSLYGDYDVSHAIKQNITTCIENLGAKGVITYEKCANGRYLIAMPEDDPTVYYAVIDFAHLGKIMRCPFDRKGKLFRFLCYMMGSRNNQQKVRDRTCVVGDRKLGYFTDELDWNYDTVRHYNKLLVDLNIIYIVHTYEYEDGVVRTVNVYGAYEDKELIDEYTHNEDGSLTAKFETGNHRRRVKAKKQALDANPEKYDIYETHKRNNQYNNLMEELDQKS